MSLDNQAAEGKLPSRRDMRAARMPAQSPLPSSVSAPLAPHSDAPAPVTAVVDEPEPAAPAADQTAVLAGRIPADPARGRIPVRQPLPTPLAEIDDPVQGIDSDVDSVDSDEPSLPFAAVTAADATAVVTPVFAKVDGAGAPKDDPIFGAASSVKANDPADTSASGGQDGDEPPTRPTKRRKHWFLFGFIGILGELMITLGLLLGLYVVWELVWTNVEAGQLQATMKDDFAAREGYVAAPTTTPEDAAKHHEQAPYLDSASIPELTQFGFLHVPRWEDGQYDRSITQGVDRTKVLNVSGIGHYPETQMPGQPGNFALAAHRTTYGKPFADEDTLEMGDSLVVETDDIWYVYKVIGNDIVTPDQVQVVYPVPMNKDAQPTKSYITLTTCHPKFSASHRFVVWGELDYWMYKKDGTPAELSGNGAGLGTGGPMTPPTIPDFTAQ